MPKTPRETMNEQLASIKEQIGSLGWELKLDNDGDDDGYWVEAVNEEHILTLNWYGEVAHNGEVVPEWGTTLKGNAAILVGIAKQISAGEPITFREPDLKEHPGITFDVKKIVVQKREGFVDKVYIHTFHPSPYPPAFSKEPLVLQFDVAEGDGVEYVKKLTGLDPEIIVND